MTKPFKLTKAVLENSTATNWQSAVTEWEIVDQDEDVTMETECVCGKEGLRYLFTIKNTTNENVLYPIGSKCIKRFEVDELTNEVNVKEQMFKLMHGIEDRKFITLTSDWFSRKLLTYLYERGTFKPSAYNNFDPKVDYRFLMDMFNQHKEPTEKQQRKITALIMSNIFPDLKAELAKKQTD